VVDLPPAGAVERPRRPGHNGIKAIPEPVQLDHGVGVGKRRRIHRSQLPDDGPERIQHHDNSVKGGCDT
jgi:hypothetical protein